MTMLLGIETTYSYYCCYYLLPTEVLRVVTMLLGIDTRYARTQ